MKFAILATFLVSAQAGFTVLSPACSLVSPTGRPYTISECTKKLSSFDVPYKGKTGPVKGKIINLPACDADGEPKGRCYAVNEALFGVNPYGEQISGMLFYNFLGKDKTGCGKIDPTFGFTDDDTNPTRKILLVDRGTCSFVRKVRMGQNAGAAAVIVMDNQYHHNKRVFMANDGSGDDIKIPSVFVDYDTGVMLKTALTSWNDNTVRVSLDWALPETKGKVRWSLWTSAEDRVAKTFKENFQLAFQRLGAKHQVFTPHFQISDGSRYCFRPGADDKTINICGDTCLYGGFYCAISTDPGLSHSVRGKHIVAENFRQLCIFNATAGADRDKATSMWWDYIDLFNLKCSKYSVHCSEVQMTTAGYSTTDIANVRKCTGYGSTPSIYDYKNSKGQSKNSLLDAEIRQQKEDNIFTIPTIIINDEPYRGGYTCPHPPQLASCGVLSAVCSAYIDGMEPPACATDYCWDMIDDCGTCLKAADYKALKNLNCCDKTPGKRYDSCGHCMNETNPNFNKCYQQGIVQMTSGVVAGIVAVFVILVFVIAAVVIVAVLTLQKKDQETRRYVDSVVSSYLPMEDEDDGGEDETATLKKQEQATATL